MHMVLTLVGSRGANSTAGASTVISMVTATMASGRIISGGASAYTSRPMVNTIHINQIEIEVLCRVDLRWHVV